jgi:hypothetical protein
MNGPVRFLISCAIGLSAVTTLAAQATLQTTPPPAVTAETSEWYRSGEPVMFAGNFYYRAGAPLHFNGSEMVRTGTYEGVPLYSRTTIEPYSLVYVPLAGGIMQPYERRRDGQLAGTVGSYTPSFPVATSRDIMIGAPAAVPMAEAPAPPMLEKPEAIGSAPRPAPAPPTFAPMSTTANPPLTLSATGTASEATRPIRLMPQPIVRRADAQNGVFVEYDGARWFSSGPPAALDPTRFTRIGEVHGFPVYSARDGKPSTIYMPVARDVDVVAPYTKRQPAGAIVK